MRPRGNDVAAWCAALLLSLAPCAMQAQEATDQAAAAEALFREGRALLAQGKHAEACPKFAASHRLDPGYGALWNFADCEERIGATATAWAAFREAADLAKKAGQADRVAKAERRAAELEPKLERMTIVVTEAAPGMTVQRDGVAVDQAAWGTALPVDPGSHRVEASAPGKQGFSVEVKSGGPGQTVTVEIPALVELPGEEGPSGKGPGEGGVTVVTPGGDEGASTRRILGIVAGGVGLAGVAVGTIFGLQASSKWSTAQDEHCRTDVLCDEEGVALTDEAKTAATVSTVGFVVGGVGIAAGVALILTSLGGGESQKAARVMVVPAAGRAGGGVEVVGRF